MASSHNQCSANSSARAWEISGIMTRRTVTFLVGLALTLPIFGAAAAPVGAHGSNAFTYEYSTITTVEGTYVVGYVMNHTQGRYFNIQMTATWRDGSTMIATETRPAFVSNLAPHAASPFVLFEDDVEIEPEYTLTLVAGASTTSFRPVGALLVEPGEFTGENTYEGTITNQGTVTAQNVAVYANRLDGAAWTGASPSEVIPSLAPGASTTYEIVFDDTSQGDTVLNLIAKTNAGPFLTSWNNYFSDLGTSLFFGSIAWMGEQGITTGCGNANFCPKDGVSRAQMAVFLDRALELPDAPDQGFTDLGTQPAGFVQAINNLAASGITSGCNASPKQFCPNQIVTRGQMSVFIVKGYGGPGNRDIEPVAGAGPFTDDDGHFSEPYNNAMHEASITTGCGVAAYCPNSAVLREQMAVFMQTADALPVVP
jgi:hypothetical protein